MTKTRKVQMGMKVALQEQNSNEEFEWTLVNQDEANPTDGRISVHCPLAQGILGHGEDEEVKVILSDGVKTYRILRIEKAESDKLNSLKT